MTWQDSDKEIEIDSQEDTGYREEDYSPLGPKKGGTGKMFQVPNWPFRWIAVGLVAVLVLVVLVFSGSDSAVPSKKLRGLEIQITQLEKRLAALEAQTGQKQTANADNSKITQYMGRFDRFEAATNKRIENLSKRVDNISKKKPATAPPVSKPATKDTPAPKAESQYHLVSKGETLYSISRAYGLTLNELRRLNKLDEKAAIYPGQKLKIK